MSIEDYKKLFESNVSIKTSTTKDQIGNELESVDYIAAYEKKARRFVPPVDFTKPKNFARFASAEKYYVDGIDRIYKTYPYDGSIKERIQWSLTSSFLDLYIFENEYPRTNGYITIAAEGWGTQVADYDGYGATATASYEYILTKGGPNTSARAKGTDIQDTTGDYKDGYANIWEPSKDRESNLKIDGIDGNTVEFWMKKSEFVTSKTGREVIFDASTSDFISSSVNYGRLTIEMTGTADAGDPSPFLITYMSGTSGFSDEVVGSSVTTSSVADDNWHHYAFTFKNTGSNIEVNFYVDGLCNQTITTGSSIDYVSGNINSTIGSLFTSPSGSYTATLGWGKLSGSLDEFRFWKTERNSKQIGLMYIEPVGGGTNTDDANASLGVYYKFNEGITLTSSTDQNMLDYSGRISNGLYTGYNSSVRSTGSAMVLSGKVAREFKDPILYSFHPDVVTYRDTKKNEGREYDYTNNSTLYYSLPSWIIEEDDGKDSSPLRNLTQIVGSYFDSMAIQISAIPQLKQTNYLSSSAKPYPFATRLLQSVGFTYLPDLFSDASLLAQYRNRDDKRIFKQKLFDLKNQIYKNIYNNIIYIYKSKGTEKSFRNLIRCFGIDDEIYRFNIYANNSTYELKDNYRSVSEYKKYVNFTATASHDATVYPHSSSTNTNSTSFISGALSGSDVSFTMETEIIFPRRFSQADVNQIKTLSTEVLRPYSQQITCSLFGAHEVSGTTENDLTWKGGDDYANFQVYAVKDGNYSKRCYFELTGTSTSVVPTLRSKYFDNVFDENKWNFSVAIYPKNYPQANTPAHSGKTDYEVVFYGVSKILDTTENSFILSGTISNTNGHKFIYGTKSIYIGAHKENFSGTLQQTADGNISSTRVWMTNVSSSTIDQHAQDAGNYGLPHPYRSAYLYQNTISSSVPFIDTLTLNWDFNTLTGSDSTGGFVGEDLASGSNDRYGWLGDVVGRQYLPKGIDFPASYTHSIAKKYVHSAKKQLPEVISSGDMVNLISDTDAITTYSRESRPAGYYLAIEKSMYQIISDEMIKMFSTIKAFNNLIGEPVNRYRPGYKKMEKLRQLFFERVGNTPDLDKFIEFYLWLDNTIDIMLQNLIPASADMGTDGDLIKNIVENNVLTRNKYKFNYPSFEDRTPDPEARVLGINELTYNWQYGHAPVPSSQDANCLWWKERAERSGPPLASGENAVDYDKGRILNVTTTMVTASAPTLAQTSSTGITTYAGSTFALRRLSRPYKLKVDQPRTYQGGANAYQNKKIGFFDAINQFKAGSQYAVEKVDRSFLEDYVAGSLVAGCDDNRALNNGKKKYSFQAKSKVGSGVFTAADEYKGQKIFPFSFYSASIAGGVNTLISDDFIENIDITNMHIDSTNLNGEVPAQSPFTDKFVGGRTHRHVFSNFAPNRASPDSADTRLEGYVLDLSSNAFKLYNADYGRVNKLRSQYFRNVRVKRPVNIANIQQFTGSTTIAGLRAGRPGQVMNATNIGNYSKDYEVVMTSGRSINNKFFVQNGGVNPSLGGSDAIAMTPDGSGPLMSYTVPQRTGSGYSFDNVIVNRFAAPGGPAAMGQSALDIESAEYSPYNVMPFRNLVVRRALNELYTDHTKQFGYFSDAQYSSSWAAALDSGLTPGAYPGTSGSVNALHYEAYGTYTDATASYHKTHRNSVRKPQFVSSSGYTDDDYQIRNIYDNWFVQHQIPQTDLQYAWITASVEYGYTGSALYGFEQPDFKNASWASTDITFASSSNFATYFESSVDIVFGFDLDGADSPGEGIAHEFGFSKVHGWGALIDPVSSSDNTLGYDSAAAVTEYVDQTNLPPGGTLQWSSNRGGPAKILNPLLLGRQGPYGWPSWKQVKGAEHPVIRAHKKENRFSFAEKVPQVLHKNVSGASGPLAFLINYDLVFKDALRSQIEPPITSKYGPLDHVLGVKASVGAPSLEGGGGFFASASIKYAYGNELTYFTDKQESGDGFIDLNNNSAINFLSRKKKELIYDTLTYLITSGKVSANVNPVQEFVSLRIPETIYPREKYTYLKKMRQREFYGDTGSLWKSTRSDRNATRTNSQGVASTTESVWPLDARQTFTSSVTYPGLDTGNEGELQNKYSIFHQSLTPTTEYGNKPGVVFCRPVLDSNPTGSVSSYGTDGALILGGDTKWQSAAQSGKNPYYATYEEYVEDLRAMGKAHGIVPEFRISEHMEYYVNTKGGDFLAENNNFLTLTGSAISSSSEANFYKTYSHTDFLKYFKVVNNDYKDASPTDFKLQCNALTKFLPYNGFYPVTRTVELATQFSKSFGPTLTGSGDQQTWRTALTPFFAPGLLYNTIKSGLAVDYPIITGAFGPNMITTGSYRDGNKDGSDPRLSGSYDFRVPFEALVEPVHYMKGNRIVDSEPHPSASFDSTSSFGDPADPLYQLGMHNFLASVPEFFLSDGALSSLESLPESHPQFGNVQNGKTYVMRIVCSHSRYQTLEQLTSKVGSGATIQAIRNRNIPSFVYNPPSITLYSRQYGTFDSTPAPGGATFTIANLSFQTQLIGQKTTKYAYGSSFGPPVDAGFPLEHPRIYSAYDPYTPPYYSGYSHIEISYTPDMSGKVSLSDIFSSASISYYREPIFTGSITTNGTNYINGMQLDASLNFLQSAVDLPVQFDAEGSVQSIGGSDQPAKWIIQPKFETPVLDFSGVDIEAPAYGSGSIAKGIWHQYGSIPTGSNGITISIQDLAKAEMANPAVTESLAKLVGFNTLRTSTRIGQIAHKKKISEAVVAVPFYKDNANERKFFTINPETIKRANLSIQGQFDKLNNLNEQVPFYKPAESIIDMVRKMHKYVIPPRFDFVRNPDDVDPFAMYIFEFETELTQTDLSNIWQNLPPDSPATVQNTVAAIPHNIFSFKELLSGKGQEMLTYLPENIQWMVFKVKKKAKTNYYELTADKNDDARFQFKFNTAGTKTAPDYSYNWPYDFFSLVELIKLDSEITMKPDDGFKLLQTMTVKEFYEQEEQAVVLPGDTNSIGPEGPQEQ